MDDFIQTRGSQVKKDVTTNFMSVQFNQSKRKPKPANNNNMEVELLQNFKHETTASERKISTQMDLKKQQELEMKKARYDIIKFGMSAFKNRKIKETKVALAVNLGAKLPKKKPMNYKLYQMQRKKQTEAIKKKEQLSQFRKNAIKQKHKTKKIRRKDESDILGIYGKVQKGALIRK